MKNWKSLSPRQKLRFLWDYEKLPLAVILLLLYMGSYSLYRHATKKSPSLYAALINVAVSDVVERELTAGPEDIVSATSPVRLFTGWYLTEDPTSDTFAYVQASQMKILASIEARQLDVVLMDREAFDALAQNGYLLDLSFLTEADDSDTPGFSAQIAASLVTNMEILEDNAKEIALDPSVTYRSITREYPMAVDMTESRFARKASFSGTVYLGIMANTPRLSNALAYLYDLWK